MGWGVSCRKSTIRESSFIHFSLRLAALCMNNYPAPTHKLQGLANLSLGSVRARIHSVIRFNTISFYKGSSICELAGGSRLRRQRIGTIRQMGSTGFGFRGEIRPVINPTIATASATNSQKLNGSCCLRPLFRNMALSYDHSIRVDI